MIDRDFVAPKIRTYDSEVSIVMDLAKTNCVRDRFQTNWV